MAGRAAATASPNPETIHPHAVRAEELHCVDAAPTTPCLVLEKRRLVAPASRGTIFDSLTRLSWEVKTDDSSIHDQDDLYAWTAGLSAADGGAFSTFLASLNGGACFAGQCDWRLPTLEELQTILSTPYPCATSPCIDPIFGMTQPFNYWTATGLPSDQAFAWAVAFGDGSIAPGETKTNLLFVRAVRGGS